MAGLERLWAPWRNQFIAAPKSRRCIFCTAKRSRANRQHQVIARGKQVFALLNRYPYNNGHLMVAPYRHVGTLSALTPTEWNEVLRMLRSMMQRLRRTIRPHGFNLGINLGRTAGAGIPGHLHVHLVPRWNGDTNFLPILAHTKVISQSLDELYLLLTNRAHRSS